MREPTDEERETIQAYIDSISVDTGISFFNIKSEILKSQPPIRKSDRISIEDIDAALTKEDYCRLYGSLGLISNNTIGKILG